MSSFTHWLQHGGAWELPAGVHRVQAFDWPEVDGSRIVGYGSNRTRLVIGSAGEYGIRMKPSKWLCQPSICDLTLEGDLPLDLVQINDRVSWFSAYGVAFRGAKQSLLRFTASQPGERAYVGGCSFTDMSPETDAAAGGAILGSVPLTTIRRCRFSHRGTGWLHSIYPSHGDDMLIDKCDFHGPHCRIHFYGNDSRRVRVRKCRSYGVAPHYFSACPEASIVDCRFVDSTVRIGSSSVSVCLCDFATVNGQNVLVTFSSSGSLLGECRLHYADWAVGDRFAVWDDSGGNRIERCVIANAMRAWTCQGLAGLIRECAIRTLPGDTAEVVWPRANNCQIIGNQIITNSTRAIWNEAPSPSTTVIYGNTVEPIS